jgi:hypothetical protein
MNAGACERIADEIAEHSRGHRIVAGIAFEMCASNTPLARLLRERPRESVIPAFFLANAENF